MNTRLARLAARLDALSNSPAAGCDAQRISRSGEDLAITLPRELVIALGLREGDPIHVQASAANTLTVAIGPGDPTAR